ncbi:Aminoacylase-1 [Eumeta japonica]|uniref:Aminoacylase-1 n=1 Tax=Eumeta variegata TaxID=151549 RepID=A0A4C1U2D3_EUMVA|nr:Aminoacylase-1 [Eumeta japonica]
MDNRLYDLKEHVEPCVEFLKKQAESLSLPIKIYEVVPNKPIVVLTWKGSDPALPAILLNSHMDVVPVFEKSWTYPPFSAHIDDEGKIFARGSQDMKCVGIQYLEAIRELKASGVHLKRTLHISFVPGPVTKSASALRDDFTEMRRRVAAIPVTLLVCTSGINEIRVTGDRTSDSIYHGNTSAAQPPLLGLYGVLCFGVHK